VCSEEPQCSNSSMYSFMLAVVVTRTVPGIGGGGHTHSVRYDSQLLTVTVMVSPTVIFNIVNSVTTISLAPSVNLNVVYGFVSV